MKISKNRIYVGFIFIYSTIAIFEFYYINYIPFYYLNVVQVNRTELAFVQFFSYLFLFITPLTGFFYGKYIKKEKYGKLFYYCSNSVLCSSFLIFILCKDILFLFGIFLFIYLFSVSMIRAVMIDLFLTSSKKSEKVKNNLLLIVKIARVSGFLGVSLFFTFSAFDIYSLKFWNYFFGFGWLLSVLFIIINMVIIRKVKFLSYDDDKKEEEQTSMPITLVSEKIIKFKNFHILILYVAYFLASSDLLYSFLFSSWVENKFGTKSYIFYSSFFIIFIIGELIGGISAKKLCNNYSKIKIMFIVLFIYMILLVVLTFSSFPILMVLMALFYFLGSIASFVYASLFADITSNKKHKTFKYQLFHTYYSTASFVFIPLGTLLSSFIIVEVMILVSVFFYGLSGVLLITLILQLKRTEKKVKLYVTQKQEVLI